MFEDYYKILGVNFNSGTYKISFRYLKLSKAILHDPFSSLYREKLEQINRAYSILGQPNPRKFYNILYLQYVKGNLDMTDHANQRYLNILEPVLKQGNAEADKLLDMSRKKETVFYQSWLSFYYDFLIYPGFRFRLIPSAIVAHSFIIMSVFNLFSNNNFIDKSFIFITLNIISVSIMAFNFRKFILIKLDQKNGM